MEFIRGLLDRLLLVGGVLAGGTAPSFVAQYRQRIGGHLNQVLQDLAPFQQIANLYHGGSLDALVQHHLNSPDVTFHKEGAAIKAMMDAAQHLREIFEGLSGNLAQQLWFLSKHADPNVLSATWEVYAPSFVFSVDSIILAATTALVLWLVFHGAWIVSSFLVSRMRGA